MNKTDRINKRTPYGIFSFVVGSKAASLTLTVAESERRGAHDDGAGGSPEAFAAGKEHADCAEEMGRAHGVRRVEIYTASKYGNCQVDEVECA